MTTIAVLNKNKNADADADADTSSNTVSHSTLLEFSKILSQTARSSALPYFRSQLTIQDKQDTSPVTIADQQTEINLRACIKARFPEHGIYGEEFGSEQLDHEYTWVIDPIDGTRAFVMGIPLFTTLIALLKDGKPIFGMMDALALNETWLGFKDSPTLFNGHPLPKLNGASDLSSAQIFATTPDMFIGQNKTAFMQLMKEVKVCRFGTDGYGYGQLALGQADAVVEADLKPYDCLALVPILEGVGGLLTDWEGKPLSLNSDGRIVASRSQDLHDKILSILSTSLFTS